MSGLEINFDKSEVVVMGFSPEDQQRIADHLNCRLSVFPVNYLGMPVRDTNVLIRDLEPLVWRVKSRGSHGKGGSLPREVRPSLSILACLV